MTDKALEAAMLAGFRKGAEDFRPDPEMFVCMDATGCYHVSWNATEHRAKMASLKSTHEAHYVLSALPGEAEVVGWAYPQGEKLGVTTHRQTACDAFPGSAKPIPLVTLASLQAMQARAEKAERKRDEAYNKGYSARDEVVSACRSRAEAAEARVKEMEEVEARALVIIQPFADAADNLEDSVTGRSPIWETPAAMAIEAVDLRMAKQFYAARTALKGGSNG